MQMAKFGQLYLQGGRTNPSSDARLISQEWIDASFTQHATEGTFGIPYGYLFWRHAMKFTTWCAIGLGGQEICIDRDVGRVVIQQRDLTDDINGLTAGEGHYIISTVALDESLSFRAGNDGVLSNSPTLSPTKNSYDAGSAQPSTSRNEEGGEPTSQPDTSGSSNLNLMAWIWVFGLSVLVAVY
mmetsp:Transcript_148/g.203  ORF Transcript_148/g.203 Transcript_148/m.203 type:complete len:184 (+) Transcript_148:86-637(+)